MGSLRARARLLKRRTARPPDVVPVLTRLGGISVGRFMREYWQRRPLVVRAALPHFMPPVARTQLFALAAREDVESRLIVRHRARWTLRDGPLPRRALPPLTQPHWTLLVQGLDGVDPGAHRLLSRFRFLPDARLDDLMASFATDGGGVGPHVDNYDVFLLQARGRRRWRISRQRDRRWQPRQPLKLLARFQPTREWVLEPGDLLYLPPGVAHDGIAMGECITYSIGFRAPTYQELHDPWLARFAERNVPAGRYGDPGRRPVVHPGALPADMVTRVHRALSAPRPTRADTEHFLLEHLSESKPQVVFARPPRPPGLAAFRRAATRLGVTLDMRSRMLTGRADVALNGELVRIPGALLPTLRVLADQRSLGPEALQRAPPALINLLHGWLRAGWLHLRADPRPAGPD